MFAITMIETYATSSDVSPAFTILFALTILSWLLFLKNTKFFWKIVQLLITFFSLVLYLFMTFAPNNSDNNGDLFYRGYDFGLIHASLRLALGGPFAIFLEISFFVIRYAKFAYDYESKFYTNIAICIVLLFFQILHESHSRKNYMNLYLYKESLTKLKEKLINLLPQGLAVFDQAHNVVYSNKSWKNFMSKMIPISKNQIEDFFSCLNLEEDTNWDTVHTNSNLSYFSKVLKGLTPAMKEIRHFCTFFNESLETPKKMEISILPIFWEGKKCYTTFINDITMQESYLSLQISDKNKDKILASISHEIKTPANTILGMIQTLQMTPGLSAAVLESLKLCYLNTELLLYMVNSLLDLQEIRKNKLDLCHDEIKIEKIAIKIIEQFSDQCKQKKITLETQFDPNAMKTIIFSDEKRILQIFYHILSNSLKFTFQGKISIKIRFEEKESAQKILFEVSDTGCGMSKSDQTNLFKMFGKNENNQTVGTQGIGFGLSYSNFLLQLINNENKKPQIQIDSEENVGTTVKFYIKIQEMNTESSKFDIYIAEEEISQRIRTNHTKSLSAVSGSCTSRIELLSSPPSILIVDDNVFNLISAEKLVSLKGYKTFKAYNGKEAIEVIYNLIQKRETIGLILMDCQMPVMDGYECTRNLRRLMASKEIPDIPIVALSANTTDTDKKNCLEAGMDEHLSKPLIVKDLERILNKYMREKNSMFDL